MRVICIGFVSLLLIACNGSVSSSVEERLVGFMMAYYNEDSEQVEKIRDELKLILKNDSSYLRSTTITLDGFPAGERMNRKVIFNPLDKIIMADDLSALKKLIVHDKNLKDYLLVFKQETSPIGGSSLHFAAAIASIDMFSELLLEVEHPDIIDSIGQTPLFYALESPSKVKALLENKADPLIKDQFGTSPICLAESLGRKDVLNVFNNNYIKCD